MNRMFLVLVLVVAGWMVKPVVAANPSCPRVIVVPLETEASCPALTTSATYIIGQNGPAGGVVFYLEEPIVNGHSSHGLEAARVDQTTTSSKWYCYGIVVAGVDEITTVEILDSNSGAVNTPLIAAACEGPGGEAGAATVAADYVWPNGQQDGFLPNKEELNLLYAQKGVVGGFGDYFYGSSSQGSSINAWTQYLKDGTQLSYSKNTTLGVRAVRAF